MERTHEVRHEALLQLYGSKEIPLAAGHIRKVARRGGFDYSEQEVRDALFFLTGQEFITRLPNAATGEVRYQITSKGMLHWEQNEA